MTRIIYKRFLDNFIDDPIFPGITRTGNYQMVDQDKFDLVPKKEYLEAQIKDMEDAVKYHEEKAQYFLREIKELKKKLKAD